MLMDMGRKHRSRFRSQSKPLGFSGSAFCLLDSGQPPHRLVGMVIGAVRGGTAILTFENVGDHASKSVFTLRREMASKHGTTQERVSPMVKLDVRAGTKSDDGKESRSYVYQIVGPNKDRQPTEIKSGKRRGVTVIYDWIIAAVKDFKVTERDEAGHFVKQYDLGDGIYRVTAPNAEFKGWSVDTFVAIRNGQIVRLSENEARQAVGLAPLSIGAKSAPKTVPARTDAFTL